MRALYVHLASFAAAVSVGLCLPAEAHMGGMGGAHGKGAKGEEDAEHQRPTYLVEGDPDEVFGTDLRTAPPVIGE